VRGVPVIFTKGDLLQTPNLHAFAHGCDFTGAMASGLSLAFKKRWPAMFEDVQQRVADRRPQIGDLLVWTDGTDTVYSLVLQETAEKKAKLTAFDRAVQAMIKAAAEAKIEQIGMGRIGAGPAGLDWLRVKRVLTERTEGAPVTVNVYEQFVRTKTE
jgi:O-acetyl-ADP-ribose deacetylase (regulator of RNase III)